MQVKSDAERISSTLDLMTDAVLGPELFAGRNAGVWKTLIAKRIARWSASETRELNTALSLGGIRAPQKLLAYAGIKSDATGAETRIRELRRLLLLIYRVVGYHSHAETMLLRDMILNQSYEQIKLRAEGEISEAFMCITADYWTRNVPRRHRGLCVRAYDQEKDPRMKEAEISDKGWCLGMTVHWLASKAENSDFWEAHIAPEAPAKYRFIMTAQRVRVTEKNADDRSSFFLVKYGLKCIQKLVERADLSAGRLARMITSSPGTHIAIGMPFVESGGHAMAAFRENDTIKFFDPLLGEFSFETLEGFEAWFPHLMKRMQYQARAFNVDGYTLTGPVRAILPKEPDVLKDAMAARRAALRYDDD